MCGRFTLTVSPEDLQAAFPNFSIPGDIPPSYNIAPSQPIPVIPNDGKNALDFFLWGLIPSWTKPEKIGKYSLINARSETAADKPSFKASFHRRRCLILADGFYEWSKPKSGGPKTPYYFTLKEKEPFAFAGLWETWISPEGDPVKSAAILTTTPNQIVKPIHNRMPVILHPKDYQIWLDPAEGKAEDFQPLLKPFPDDLLETYPVSTYVNSPKNNSPLCIQPGNLL
jgi:putative SOS response-associated peptidase YedK